MLALSLTWTFLTKPRSSFRLGYVAKAGIWDFRSVRSRPELFSFAAIVADLSPLQA